MKYRRNRYKSDKINNRTRTVNGVHVFQKVGFWYCDYNTFTAVMGKHIGIENFCSWCDRFDLIPT